MSVYNKLESLGIKLPEAIVPIANYVPFVISGNLVFISGQLPVVDGVVKYTGKVGAGNMDYGVEAARVCAINIISQLENATNGDLNKVLSCVQISVFVNSGDDFIDQPKIANGASDLIVALFGDSGKHSRCAVSTNSLPRGASVEIAAVFKIKS